MNFLKILPLSKRRLDVLFEIYAKGEDYLRNISKSLRMNPSLTFNILNRLHDSQFIIKRKLGKEVQYSLNRNRDYILLVSLLEEYYFEKTIKKVKTLKAMINLLINNKELMKSSHKIYLFGSYVLGNYSKDSDIDLLFVNEDKKLVGKACREISVVVGKNLNPLIYTKEGFKSDLSKKEPLLDSIVNNNSLEIDIEILDKIKEVAFLAKNIEGEGTTTRYGTIEEGKLISPEDKYDKLEADKFLKDLKEILINLKEIFKETSNLKQDLPLFTKFIKECEDLLIE